MDELEDPLTGDTERHYQHSVLRERIVEHVEVLRSEFDAGGYDL